MAIGFLSRRRPRHRARGGSVRNAQRVDRSRSPASPAERDRWLGRRRCGERQSTSSRRSHWNELRVADRDALIRHTNPVRRRPDERGGRAGRGCRPRHSHRRSRLFRIGRSKRRFRHRHRHDRTVHCARWGGPVGFRRASARWIAQQHEHALARAGQDAVQRGKEASFAIPVSEAYPCDECPGHRCGGCVF